MQGASASDFSADLQQIVQSIVGAAVAHDQPFMEAGVDSLGAVELRNGISAKFGMADLPATLVFDYPTISALAQYLATSRGPAQPEAAPSAAVVPAVRPQDAAWLSRASEVVGLSCRYPGSSTGVQATSLLLIETPPFTKITWCLSCAGD